jgi:AcrR family transcriptional regulator
MAEAAAAAPPIRRASRTPRLPAEHVLRAARRVFLAGGTLEMRALARELGIGRATLYRWRGGRLALLSEVISSLGVANLRRADEDVRLPHGAERLCRVHDLHLRRISESGAMQEFIRNEPDMASRVLLDAGGKVHRDVTAALAALIEHEAAASGWRPPLEPDRLAAAVSRLSEAFLYSELIAHARSDVATPDLVLRLMLGLPLREG